MPRIAILLHRYDSLQEFSYFLTAIAEIWKEQGFEVVYLHGPTPGIRADLAICHVNLTVVPPDYLGYLRQFPKTLNGRVADISKRIVSKHLLEPNADWQGPVFVKSNLNSKGSREERLIRARVLPGTIRPIQDYQVYERLSEVPDEVWGNRDLVVEKFLPERQDDLYCLRTWMFLGDRETNSICFSKEPIVKAGNVIRREPLGDVPDDLRQWREELAFDFGKFDYAVSDGKTVLYDANRTPTLPNLKDDSILPRLRHLAEGIHRFLPAVPA